MGWSKEKPQVSVTEVSPPDHHESPPDVASKKGSVKEFVRLSILPLKVPLAFIFILLAVLVYLLLSIAAYRAERPIDCDPNGNIWVSLNYNGQLPPDSPHREDWLRKNAWAPHYLLAITVGWGNLSFATAKAIDVTWDWVVGRGWQTAAAWIVYKVFRRSWARSLSGHERRMPVETAMALQYNTASLEGLWTYLRALTAPASKAWDCRISTSVLALCVVYVLLAPTWISAMTGYVALSKPMISLDGIEYIDSAQLKTCQWLLVDGERVGMDNNTCLTSFSEYPSIEDYRKHLDYSNKDSLNDASIFDGVDRTYHLDPPRLEFLKTETLTMGYQGQLYHKSDIENSGTCQPTNRYRWGFSYQLTFGFLLTTNILSIALFFTWCAAGPRKGSERADKTFNRLRTAMLVAEAIAETCGEDRMEMSNAELKRAMRSSDTGITVSTRRRPRLDKLPLLARLEQLPPEDLCEPSRQAMAVLRSRDDLRNARLC